MNEFTIEELQHINDVFRGKPQEDADIPIVKKLRVALSEHFGKEKDYVYKNFFQRDSMKSILFKICEVMSEDQMKQVVSVHPKFHDVQSLYSWYKYLKDKYEDSAWYVARDADTAYVWELRQKDEKSYEEKEKLIEENEKLKKILNKFGFVDRCI